MQKTAWKWRIRIRGSSVRPTGSGRRGQGVPNRGQVADHAQMDLPKQVAPKRIVQPFQRLASRLHVQGIAGFQRAVNGVAAGLIDTFCGAEHILQCPEEAEIGGVGHRICLSLKNPERVYTGQS